MAWFRRRSATPDPRSELAAALLQARRAAAEAVQRRVRLEREIHAERARRRDAERRAAHSAGTEAADARREAAASAERLALLERECDELAAWERHLMDDVERCAARVEGRPDAPRAASPHPLSLDAPLDGSGERA